MTSKPHVLIAGAGVGGLTAALALLRRGFDVDVYEQATELKGLGAGVQIAANGSRVLGDLGLRPAIEAVAVEAEAKQVRLWNTGQAWRRSMRSDPPYWFLHRGDLHQVLAGAVRGLKPDAIHLNAAAAGFDQREDRAVLELADGRRIEGAVLVGADGVHSPLRRRLFGQETDARFTGLAAWRGLVPIEALPEELREPVGTSWQGPGAHVVTYPVHAGRLLNFVGVVEDEAWREESWTARGTVEACLADFEGWHPYVQAVIRNIEVPYKWALLSRQPLARWAAGRVCLIGDASHPTLPFLAQGANMALEDGLIIARCLEACSSDPAAALARFEALRLERTSRIVRGSAENTARFHNAVLADPVAAVAYLDAQWRPDEVGARYDWIHDYDARTVPV
jgi:salicylate hydroxylase